MGFLYEDTMSSHFQDRSNRLSMSHHTLSDLTPKSTLTSHSDHHSVAVVQDVSRERTPKRAGAAAETNPTKRRPIITVLILNKKSERDKKKKKKKKKKRRGKKKKKKKKKKKVLCV